MSRLHSTFERLRQQGRKALIPYVTAGYPSADITPALMHVLVEAGADIIELSVPFSTPRQTAQRSRHPPNAPCDKVSACRRCLTMCDASANPTPTRRWC